MAAAPSTSTAPPPDIDWETMSFSKTLNKSLLTVKQPDGTYRIYRLIRAYRETQHFRCSTCDRLNAKKNTRYMPKVRTKSGKLVGDPYPPHNPECLPLSVEEYGLRQIDRLCRWYIREKHVPPKAAWEMGRKYCRQYAERHRLHISDFMHSFPEFERLRATYTRIYNQAGGQHINVTDDLSTMTLDVPPPVDEENLEFLYAADRDQPVPVKDTEEWNDPDMTAHDLRRKLDQLTSVVELPINPETGEKVFTVTYDELRPQVVCTEGHDDVTLFFSKKCRPQITFRGYVYYLFTEKSQAESMFNHRRWHCIEPRCTGFVVTDEDISKIVDCNVVHMGSCVPDVNKVRMKVEMYHLRLLAEYTTCPVQQLYADFCDRLLVTNRELLDHLPSIDIVTRMLDRHRTQYMIRTRFEFEQLNRIARSGFEENGNATLRRRINKVFPKTVCFHCGVEIGEGKSSHLKKFAQEGLVDHLVGEHNETDVDAKSSVSMKISQFKAYLRHVALKKYKFIRKGFYAGGTYYLCQCDDRVYGYKHQNTIPGVHCPAYIRVVDRDDSHMGSDEEAAIEFNMNHMFHEDAEDAETFMTPEEFLKTLPEESVEVDKEDDENKDDNTEEKSGEPASKRPRRQVTLKTPKYLDMNAGVIEENTPSTSQSRPVRKARTVRKVNKINYAVAEQLDEFEAHLESLRDRVKSLKSPDEITRVNAKLQELEDEISGKLEVQDEGGSTMDYEHIDVDDVPPLILPIAVSHLQPAPPQLTPVFAQPARHQVTVVRSALPRQPIPSTTAPPRVRLSQVGAIQTPLRRLYSIPIPRQAEQPQTPTSSVSVSEAQELAHDMSEAPHAFKYALRKPDGSVIFLTKTPTSKMPKRVVRLTPVRSVVDQDADQPIEVVEAD
ncbi:hypothetical protein QR680_007801 [Steinernema hermaphroditum]|uniref:RYYR-CCHC domain-containing protein n=1 Tax=Steinernema hermaphroditum TaxID=289476 RepID=A0AA39IEA0_9BILA|nr:hypothetical protein QR680_007801 [Steinernema hermaphroditum]